MTPPLLAHSAVATTRLSPAVQEPRVALNPSPESTDRPSFAPNAASVAIAAGAAVAFAAVAAPAQAFSLHMEPANALSLPTWAVHTSSLIEWVTAMGLMWKYADVTGNQKWKGMTWGMLPFFCSGLCACTWHLFYNSPDLEVSWYHVVYFDYEVEGALQAFVQLRMHVGAVKFI